MVMLQTEVASILTTSPLEIKTILAILLVLSIQPTLIRADDESDYYRLIDVVTSTTPTDSRAANWIPSELNLDKERPVLEVSGMAPWDDDRIAVSIRKGEVWLIKGAYNAPAKPLSYHRFASGLHEPLGLLRLSDGLATVQRTEMTRLHDSDGDDVADEYQCLAKGWGVTGHYHEYAYGPKRDGQGNLWLTLNIGLGLKGEQLDRTHTAMGYRQGLWRGWGMKVHTGGGELQAVCAGMRSPCGLGANAAGDMFYTDQQGNWVATGSLHHMREGAFFHHPESLASMDAEGSPIAEVAEIPNGLPLPQALKRFPQMKPPAVWFPYKKMGQSTTDILLDESGGKFGPFSGQLFVGEFTQAGINRVFLEKVDGEYQGACFPFRSGFASAVLRLMQGSDGSVFAGLTNRGWSSLGTASHGLQRLVWTGETPFEIQTMRAKPDGFELRFTRPVDPATARDIRSYQMERYTYNYHSTYGSDEIQRAGVGIIAAELQPDGQTVRLKIEPTKSFFVHELTADGIRDVNGRALLHTKAYYTLNRIPNL